jgi:hypothetical protein
MNKSLTWGKTDNKYGFTGFTEQKNLNQNFPDSIVKNPKELLLTLANKCRGSREPIFSDDTKCFDIKPETTTTTTIVSVDLKSSKDLTEPPKKEQDKTILNAILIGLAVALAVKIIS